MNGANSPILFLCFFLSNSTTAGRQTQQRECRWPGWRERRESTHLIVTTPRSIHYRFYKQPYTRTTTILNSLPLFQQQNSGLGHSIALLCRRLKQAPTIEANSLYTRKLQQRTVLDKIDFSRTKLKNTKLPCLAN